MKNGESLYSFAEELWPICRSLTGDGVRKTLSLIQEHLPDLKVHAVPSGEKCFDWEVPSEWNIQDAYLIGPDGEIVVDFKVNNLHVVGYSEPIDCELELEELRPHLFSLPTQPTAIPYITSYYRRFWGFCMTHEQLESLKPGRYRAVIKSRLEPGVLNYADLVLPGREREEIFFSTYVCHPSLANNELSGPVVTTALAEYLLAKKDRRYTYRFMFIPETIGSIVYLSRHADLMRQRTIAGFVVTCVGDDRTYSFLQSPSGETLADRVAKHVLSHHVPAYKAYDFLERGSDERQYCSPGIDLPVVSLMRSKYGEYPEYHTSLDDLSLISPSGLGGAFSVYRECIEVLEANRFYQMVMPCEPQLGKRGLYPSIGTKENAKIARGMMNFMAFCNGQRDLLSIASRIGMSVRDLKDIAERLLEAGVIEQVLPSHRTVEYSMSPESL